MADFEQPKSTADVENGVTSADPAAQPQQQHVSIISISEEGEIKIQQDSVTPAEVDGKVESTGGDTKSDEGEEGRDSRVSSHGGDTASTLSGIVTLYLKKQLEML